MRYTDDFNDYELIDAADGLKLERWKDIILIRPEPQAVWRERADDPRWNSAHAVYHRSDKGGGSWEMIKKVPDVWTVSYRDLTFRLKPMGFKHTGLFPEQAVNWKLAKDLISSAKRPLRILNLFAYTGGATVACLSAGASVTHVDASKGMVLWAKENAASCGLSDKPCRWLVDDCLKFLQREKRRGSFYDGIIMDPPSYGRGPNGEMWKLENQIYDLLTAAADVMSDDPEFFILNTYTAGFSPTIINYLAEETIAKRAGKGQTCGFTFTDEIGLKMSARDMILPCGNTTVWTKEKLR